MTYELYYWPTIQGRGEFVRLALEQGGADYLDMARLEGPGRGVEAMMRLMKDEAVARPSFAPPFLRDGEVMVGQTAAILAYLGPKLGLAPEAVADRVWVDQIQLTLADLVAETHDTHHPVDLGAYYRDQKPEAARKAEGFRGQRIPKFLGWIEQVLVRNPAGSGWLVGARPSYADLSAFQVVEGLRYAFPKAAQSALAATPGLVALAERVRALPKIAAYLASERWIAFNEDGIFRHYPELDAQA